ncbi:MAG: integrase [Microvirga sp.]|jgi:integrase|nr:integrase [Microvirga sp.]
MSLVKRPNSKFWYVQFQLKHQTVIRSTRTTDRRVAERVAAKIRAEAHEEIVEGRKKPLTLEQALKRYIASREGMANHRNLLGHRDAILSIISGSLPLTSITSTVVEDFVRKRVQTGRMPQTVKHTVNCLFAAMKAARKAGYACADPERPTIKVANKMVRYLSRDEEERLLSALDPDREVNGVPLRADRKPERQRWMQDNYDLIVLLLDTGARYSEIANIRWSQIDLSHRAINLWRSKVQNESVIFMTDRVAAILERRSRNRIGDHVFTNKAGKARGYSAIAIRKALRRAGLHDCTIHTLRHTHATRLIQNGLNVYEVKAVLGHADIKTTMRYAHLEQAAVTQKARDVINRLNAIHEEATAAE